MGAASLIGLEYFVARHRCPCACRQATWAPGTGFRERRPFPHRFGGVEQRDTEVDRLVNDLREVRDRCAGRIVAAEANG